MKSDLAFDNPIKKSPHYRHRLDSRKTEECAQKQRFSCGSLISFKSFRSICGNGIILIIIFDWHIYILIFLLKVVEALQNALNTRDCPALEQAMVMKWDFLNHFRIIRILSLNSTSPRIVLMELSIHFQDLDVQVFFH